MENKYTSTYFSLNGCLAALSWKFTWNPTLSNKPVHVQASVPVKHNVTKP